jgi:hypothetical protein
MRKLHSQPVPPLTAEQLTCFTSAVQFILAADYKSEDYHAVALLRQLHGCGLRQQDLEHFAQIVLDACDADMRSPK